VRATGQIGLFKIVSESAVAAGIRRIEAITSVKAEQYFTEQLQTLHKLKELLKNPKDLVKSVQSLMEENTALGRQVEGLYREKAKAVKSELKAKAQQHNGIQFICEKIVLDSAEAIKDIAFELKQAPATFLVLGAEVKGKPSLTVAISDDLVKEKKLNAGAIVRELAKEIQGGGGGQPNYANAGGSNIQGIDKALEKAKAYIS
jgi:alanyl-tRNA synthetase